MGARNPGQLRLNFGTAILMIVTTCGRFSNDRHQKTRRQNVAIWPQNQR